jgi:hypothetical protein
VTAATLTELRHVLAIPHLAPRGAEVKLFFRGAEPAPGSTVELCSGTYHAQGRWGHRLFLPMPDAALWSPEDPQLHWLTVAVGGEARRIRFGLRRVEAKGGKLLLNGESFYVRGFGCDGDPRGCLHRQVQTPAGFRRYVERARQFGFNVMRSHKERNDRPEAFMDACDELGLFLWPEFRFDPDGDWSILAHFWNHPCVIWWCWGNEIGQDELHPWAQRCYEFIKLLDPSRLVLDNSGWGAFDRTTTDLISQHLGYYFPHGKRAHCYSSYALLAAEGSLSGESHADTMQRMREGTFRLDKPLLAHETGNHQAFPDVVRRADRMTFHRRDRLRDKVLSDRRARYLPNWIEASTRFKLAMDKLWMEQVRKSPIVEGYEMWMLSDHGNVFAGLIEDGEDCRIKPGIDPQEFAAHNAADVLLADFPRDNFQRIFLPGETFSLRVLASVYGPQLLPPGPAHWEICCGNAVLSEGSALVRGASRGGVAVLGDLSITLPRLHKAAGLKLRLRLPRQSITLINGWNLWCFPDVPKADPGDVLVTRSLTDPVLAELDHGRSVLLCLEESSFVVNRAVFQSVFARFRPQIWEWGHNLGAAVPDHPALAGFPHEGFSDLQWYRPIDGGRKIILDAFPLPLDPIVHAVDLPMMTYSEEIYARIGTYLFELSVGAGRLLVSGFNFSPDAMQHVEVRTLQASLLRYVASSDCQPRLSVTKNAFAATRDRMLREPQTPARLSAETAWDVMFYKDDEANGRDRFTDAGEVSPHVRPSLGDYPDTKPDLLRA